MFVCLNKRKFYNIFIELLNFIYKSFVFLIKSARDKVVLVVFRIKIE